MATGSPDPAGLCSDQGAVDLRHQRQVRGGRLPEVGCRARCASPRPARAPPTCSRPCPPATAPAPASRLRPPPASRIAAAARPAGSRAPPTLTASRPPCAASTVVRPQAERRGVRRRTSACPTSASRASAAGRACTGVCKSCALPASRGACSNSRRRRRRILRAAPDKGPASCGTDGRCDGSGACRLYGASTVCAALRARRTSRRRSTRRTCNGLGDLPAGDDASRARRTSATARRRAGRRARATATVWRPPSATGRPTAAATRSASARRARPPTSA